MSGVVQGLLAAGACGCAFVAAGAGLRAAQSARARAARKERAGGRLVGASGQNDARRAPAAERNSQLSKYLRNLTIKLYAGATQPLSPSVRAGRTADTRAGTAFADICKAAGCSKTVSASAYCEARVRLGLLGLALGALIGVALSAELAIILAAVGLLVGRNAPARELKRLREERAREAQHRLSEMLEVVALGMRSGLTFDRAFSLYGEHFSSPFAQACALAYKRWTLGLSTREESMRDLAESYDCEQLKRVVGSILRDLKLGGSLTSVLEESARQARATYKAQLEEKVAKAPVKMMLPTGALILPAMLMLVMGPILLELAGGF